MSIAVKCKACHITARFHRAALCVLPRVIAEWRLKQMPCRQIAADLFAAFTEEYINIMLLVITLGARLLGADLACLVRELCYMLLRFPKVHGSCGHMQVHGAFNMGG